MSDDYTAPQYDDGCQQQKQCEARLSAVLQHDVNFNNSISNNNNDSNNNK